MLELELSQGRGLLEQPKYEALGRHVASKMNIADADAACLRPGLYAHPDNGVAEGTQNFDLDIVVKLTGPRVNGITNPEPFFQAFGSALEGITGAGDPKPKRRCWRLSYPGEPFYFDVTPALPDSRSMGLGVATDLRVRDPDTRWSPSNLS